jgi:hypothetical protein
MVFAELRTPLYAFFLYVQAPGRFVRLSMVLPRHSNWALVQAAM